MKVSDFIHRYKISDFYRYDFICRVRIFVGYDDKIFSVFTDLGEKSTASSVTNSVEDIRADLIEKGLISESTRVIEHYDNEYPEGGSFDFVSFDNNNCPKWRSSNLYKVCSILQCSTEEFIIPSLEIQRIYNEIEKIRYNIDHHIGEPWTESYEVINRREDIRSNMISKSSLQAAIDNGASETEIQGLIKSDLSIIGDFYSQPFEEYICFSEFPLGEGFVDFVVFSGRSRMDVTLIEIKGANYNLINGNSYEDFSYKTNQAVQQIRKRIGYITRKYEEFWYFVHQVREDIENGQSRYGSLIGPKGNLGVDPQKDIVLHTVVIGGRSKDDIKESRLRHEYEMANSPSIRVESWDSWIKKLNRE